MVDNRESVWLHLYTAYVRTIVDAERTARRLLGLYLGSSPARQRVGPRAAIVDLLCVSQLRKAATSHDGVGFQVEVDIDHKAHHLTLRSVTTRTRPSDPSITEDAIAALLAEHPWDFTWDHTEVAAEAHAPILGRLTTPLYLESGVRDLRRSAGSPATTHTTSQQRSRPRLTEMQAMKRAIWMSAEGSAVRGAGNRPHAVRPRILFGAMRPQGMS